MCSVSNGGLSSFKSLALTSCESHAIKVHAIKIPASERFKASFHTLSCYGAVTSRQRASHGKDDEREEPRLEDRPCSGS